MSTAQSTPPDACRRRDSPGRACRARPSRWAWCRSTTPSPARTICPIRSLCCRPMCRSSSADPGRYAFLPPLYKRVRIADAVEALKDADLVGFSTYVWNGRISLEIARRLKAAEARHRHRVRRPARARPARGVPARQPADRPRGPQRGRAHVPEAAGSVPGPRRLGRRCRASASSSRTAASCATPTSTACAISTRFPRPSSKAPSIRSWRPIRSESWIGLWETNRGCPFRCTFCDWGSATAGQGHQVRRGAAVSRGRLVRREEDRVHLLLRRQLRHPEARRRHRQVCRRHQAGDRLSGRPFGAEHQERDRARLSDAEDPVRRRAQQGRGALHAERRHDDPRGDQARQHLARHLHGAAAPLHARQGRDLLGPDPRPARRDLRIVRARASTS